MGTNDKSLRILILEDVAEDAELIEREVRQANIGFISRRAASRETFISAFLGIYIVSLPVFILRTPQGQQPGERRSSVAKMLL